MSRLIRPASAGCAPFNFASTCRGFQINPSSKPALGKLTITRPTAFSQRANKSAVRSFRREFNNSSLFNTEASYKSAMWAVGTLILLNGGVFGAWTYASNKKDTKLLGQLEKHATLSEHNLAAGRYYTCVTSAFSHKELQHFAFNMFALFTYGKVLAAVPGIGALHIYGLAVTSSIAASAAFITHRRSRQNTQNTQQKQKKGDPWHTIFSDSSSNNMTGYRTIIREVGLGASGVVMATAAAATCLRPLVTMMIFPIPLPLPLFVVTGLLAAADAYLMDGGGKTGHDAHLGGFACGAVYYLLLLRNKGGIWRMLSRR